MCDALPGMDEELSAQFAHLLGSVVAHGYGQVAVIISQGKVTNIVPAPSLRACDDVGMIFYQQDRRARRGSKR